MSYNRLLPLIKKTKSHLTPKEFQERINIVFHDYEANHYDQLHKDMFESLQEQISLLIDDLFNSKKELPNNLKLLDIGAGTGLSTQLLLNTKIGSYIEEITLLDTSLNMLKRAEEKAKKWGKKFYILNSEINEMENKYDVIIICSVLHHIPILTDFLQQVENLLNPGGILIHLQDPNADYLKNAVYISRLEEFQKVKKLNSKQKGFSMYIPKNWKNSINRLIGRKSYIDLINEQLLKEKVIKKRMSADEMWSVTDIHVESKFNNENPGISFQFLQNQLKNFKLISHRSYGFFGSLKSDLTEDFKKQESYLISQHELNGRNISGIWMKN